MRKLVHLIPKPILFGLLGALGCVLGWAAGEPLLKVIKPPVPKAGEEAKGQPAAPVLVFSNELQKRLQREEAKTGDVQISLMWTTSTTSTSTVSTRAANAFSTATNDPPRRASSTWT